MTDTYHVWRRSDGYVSGSAGGLPAGNHGTDRDGTRTTLTELLVTDDWYGEAVPLIEAERARNPLAAGWWMLSGATESS
jgi:hypothetical protein